MSQPERSFFIERTSTEDDVKWQAKTWQGAGKELHYHKRKSKNAGRPSILLINGLHQDMDGEFSKAIKTDACMNDYHAVVFDFAGVQMGNSNIACPPSLCSWLEDSLNILDRVCGPEQQILVAFFTGAWIALHLALQRPHRIQALVLVAPAVDITRFWWQHLSGEDQAKCTEIRKVPLPGLYGLGGKSLPLTFYQEAEELLLMDKQEIGITQPVRIIQGMKDTVVPPALSRDLMAKLASDDVHITLIKEGEHIFNRAEHKYPVFQAISDLAGY